LTARVVIDCSGSSAEEDQWFGGLLTDIKPLMLLNPALHGFACWL